ncbi:MAG: RNA chaperone Hfq [Candidatus Gastranaerophilaceae bacterium]|jgi:host factor-I protein|nr:RNA chaperone Hfq [Christensenellales bacterium]
MALNPSGLQDAVLYTILKEQLSVEVFITNGYHIANAKIVGFDSYCMVIETGSNQTLIYKHAISSIVPSKRIDINLKHLEDKKQHE